MTGQYCYLLFFFNSNPFSGFVLQVPVSIKACCLR